MSEPGTEVQPPEEARNDRIEVYKDRADEWRWRYRAANGRKIADGAEGYQNIADAMKGAAAVTARTLIFVETKDGPVPGPNHLRVVVIRG